MKQTVWMAVGVAFLVLCSTAAAAEGWQTDYEKALKTAKESGKYILMDFSGSDWCGWCVKLDKEVFSKDAFKTFAKENLVLVLVDFPQRKPQDAKQKAQNRALMKKYGVQGFPTVLVQSPDGKVVAKTGYRRGGPKPYVEHLKQIIEAHKAKAKDKAA